MPRKIARQRIDVLLVERGLVESREMGKRLVMAGEVTVNRQMVFKPGTRVPADADIQLKARPPFVSRGGEKLNAALQAFAIDAAGRVCADVGASTGGFTDCLLQRGARKVYAIDVGYGQLAVSLRNDPRVVVMERTNARHLEALPEPVSLATIDASFISLRLVLPAVAGWLKPFAPLTPHPPLPPSASLREAGERGSQTNSTLSPRGRRWRAAPGEGDSPLSNTEGAGEQPAEVVALVKPQFEAGKREADRGGGVIRDPVVHKRVLREVLGAAAETGFAPKGLIRSPLKGPAGNIEFLAWLVWGAPDEEQPIESLIDSIGED